MKKTVYLLLALWAPFGAEGQIDQGLAAYYTFDTADGADASDNGLHLSLFGGVAFEPGLIGLALAPNGDNNRYAAREVDDEALDFGLGDFTVQAWVNYNNLVGEQILLEKFSGNSGPGWTLTKLRDNALAFSSDVGGTPLVRSPVQDIALDTWHNVTIRKTAGLYELFFNGAVVASVDAVAGSSSSDPLLVGRRNETDGRDFALEGSIDEIAIWTRALGDQELVALYNNGRGRSARVMFEDGFEQAPAARE